MKTVRVAPGAAAAVKGQRQVIENARKAAVAVLVAAGVSVAGTAGGAVLTDKEDDAEYIAKKPLQVKHLLTDRGYAVGVDTITSATLEIVLGDDNDSADYNVTLGSGQEVLSGHSSLRGGKTFKVVLDEPSLASLASTGLLELTISAKGCKAEKRCPDYSFEFLSSTLTVNSERLTVPEQPPADVPEPGTLSLLGLGLAGVAALNRRRTRRPGKATHGDRHGS